MTKPLDPAAFLDTMASFDLDNRQVTEIRAVPYASDLTPRERECAKLIAQGLSNKLIADRLDVSFHTAKFHVANVIHKLGVGNRAGVAAVAVKWGLA